MKFRTYIPAILIVIAAAALAVFVLPKLSLGSKEGALINSARSLDKEGKTEEAIKELEKVIAEYPESKKAGEALIVLGSLYEKQGKLVEARDSFKKAYETYPGANIVKEAKPKVEELNMKILFSPYLDSYSKEYTVQAGDSLAKIAKVFGTTVDLLRKSNNISGNTIRLGQRLKVVTVKFSVVVDKSQNLLMLKQNDDVIKIYKVATGTNNCTPVGTFKITTKLVDPVWYKAGVVAPPGSPENILGTRWMGLSKEGYGIHGTTDPSSLGKQATAGCVRMLNAEVEELYGLLPEGTEVTIVD
ncbi:MAG: L,D-transpeptidase family protein [Candidatus Omnitrophica bacterium]|jgi:lipoprotein-anchoring transpeptidase ErfK/SrfK|nr:L,D-transpeptidase family protein [Candidatus Omnitrophota bacterium]